MANTSGVFDWDQGSGGVRIVPTRDYITNAAMSEQELDAQIRAAKADLDAVAIRAKNAIKRLNKKPLLPE